MIADIGRILESLGPARKFADPESPASVKTMAARGAHPPPPRSPACSSSRAGTKRSANARRAWPNFPNASSPGAAGRSRRGAPHLARRWIDRLTLEVALNPPPDVVCFLAGLPQARLVDILATNQIHLTLRPAGGALRILRPTRPHSIVCSVLGSVPDRAGRGPTRRRPKGTSIPEAQPSPRSTEVSPKDWRVRGQVEETRRSQSLFSRSEHGVTGDQAARFGSASALACPRPQQTRHGARSAAPSWRQRVLSFAKSRAVGDEILRVIGGSRDWYKNRRSSSRW